MTGHVLKTFKRGLSDADWEMCSAEAVSFGFSGFLIIQPWNMDSNLSIFPREVEQSVRYRHFFRPLWFCSQSIIKSNPLCAAITYRLLIIYFFFVFNLAHILHKMQVMWV